MTRLVGTASRSDPHAIGELCRDVATGQGQGRAQQRIGVGAALPLAGTEGVADGLREQGGMSGQALDPFALTDVGQHGGPRGQLGLEPCSCIGQGVGVAELIELGLPDIPLAR